MASRDPSPNCMAAWRALVDASSGLLRRLEDDLEREHELSLPAYDVLITLADAPDGRLRHQDLVRYTRLTKSGVSRLVDRMEAAQLIRTESCPSDRRGAFAVITESGRRRLAGAAATHSAGIQHLFGTHLSDEEAAALTAVLQRVNQALPPGSATCAAASGAKFAPSAAALPLRE